MHRIAHPFPSASPIFSHTYLCLRPTVFMLATSTDI